MASTLPTLQVKKFEQGCEQSLTNAGGPQADDLAASSPSGVMFSWPHLTSRLPLPILGGLI